METTTKTTERTKPRTITGVVVSDKMSKTRVIELRRSAMHRLYHKNLKLKRRVFIHDEKNLSKTGDKIIAMSVRPMSKNKAYRLLKVVEKRVAE